MRKQIMGVTIAAVLNVTSPVAMAGDIGPTTLGGKMYADFTYINQTEDGAATDASGYGLDVKRFYFTVDHDFDETWSANLTTDFNYSSADGETQLFIKKAYIQSKLGDAATFRAGSADMPWIPFVDSLYGYRFVEPTITDRLHLANSADWGLHIAGRTGGEVSYQASLVNGGGYRNPTRSRNMDFAAHVAIEPVAGLTLAVGGYSGDRGKDLGTAPALHTASRYDALAAYVNDRFRVGAEYFRAANWNNVTTPATDSADGYSVFASFATGRKASLFARYDRANLSNDLDPSQTDRYYNAGVAWQLRTNIDIAIAYKHENRGDRLHQLKSSEIGIWMQVVF